MSNNRKIILVFGLSGAGKTTLINEMIRRDSSLLRLSGGSLIGGDLLEKERDNLRKLEDGQILKNQEFLVIGFLKALDQNKNKTIIFDGHCVVKNLDKLIEVPIEIIEKLTPSLIVFVNPDAETILKQRLADPKRPDREQETLEEIRQLQARQIGICQRYASTLKIPFCNLRSSTVEKFIEIIDALQ